MTSNEPTLRTVHLNVNGVDVERTVEPRMSLADFLRHEIGLTGTHLGCEHGVCGACTVMLDGAPARSCILYAVQADGHRITTVEGLATSEDELHPVQQAFWEHGALQCGFCTSGMLISAVDLLKRNPDPTEQDVREALSGNLCRCTGYQPIVAAVLDAAKRLQAGKAAQPTRHEDLERTV
jgi:carbon-monoxide dehydrogenase small subunit